jgi:hypothetical protein
MANLPDSKLTPADDWQPIASAPKDGTHIIVCWLRGKGGHTWSFRIARRGGDKKQYWLSVALHSEILKPTHWYPLPAPPLPTTETQ